MMKFVVLAGDYSREEVACPKEIQRAHNKKGHRNTIHNPILQECAGAVWSTQVGPLVIVPHSKTVELYHKRKS